MIGGNDLQMGVPVPQVAANIRSIVQTLGDKESASRCNRRFM